MQPDAVTELHQHNKYSVHVIADGGIRYGGDIPIALAAGAATVMIGQASSCKESPESYFMRMVSYLRYREWPLLKQCLLKVAPIDIKKKPKISKNLFRRHYQKLHKGHLGQIFMLAEGAKTGFGYCGAEMRKASKNALASPNYCRWCSVTS